MEKSKAATGASGRLASKSRIEHPIAAVLVFNTGANTGLPTLAEAILIQLFGADWS